MPLVEMEITITTQLQTEQMAEVMVARVLMGEAQHQVLVVMVLLFSHIKLQVLKQLVEQ